jgi:flagellar biosynthesis chaperone FliJ
MKTRFSPLVKIKKDAMDRCEHELQRTHYRLEQARAALASAYEELRRAEMPTSGGMGEYLQSRMILTLQREAVDRERGRVEEVSADLEKAEAAFRAAMIEYEKFKYLEAEEIKTALQKEKRRHEREMDEIAVQNYTMRNGS